MRQGVAVPDPADDRSGHALISDGYLAMAGVPQHYPGYGALGQDMDDAMLEACDDVLERAKASDPLLALGVELYLVSHYEKGWAYDRR